jgi:DNA repair exonuclease SbcCD ATPase subunit
VRITRLRLRDLKVHRDLDLELAPGLTVVRGPNEAGKSTLQRALELALFRKVTAGGAEIDGLRSWGAPDDGRPWVALEFVQEDPEGTRLGTLEKDFRGARGTSQLVFDGETVNDPARVDEILADLTGIPGEKFFRSTASVRHHEVFDLARDEGALRDRLQASISGADRGTSVAKRRLDRALRDLQARGERNPGRLRVAEEAVARSETILAQGEAQLAQLERDRDALAGARERRAAAEHVLAERRSLLEKAC